MCKKKYKGFKGNGMNDKPVAKYKKEKIAREALERYIAMHNMKYRIK